MKNFYSLTIAMIEQLTPDAIAITFAVPSHLEEVFTFKQGQHLTLKLLINDIEVRRSYSICSNVVEQRLKIAIKRIDGGCFSNYANDEFSIGMTVDVMPPQGHFFTQLLAQSKKHYLFVAVGSGITPILSHIKSILCIEPKAKVDLVYGNKSKASTMFHQQLLDIELQHIGRFKLINCYSREQISPEIYHGRVSTQKLINLDFMGIIKVRNFSEIFICGPQAMVNHVIASLKSWHFTDEQIHYELFHSEQSLPAIGKKNVARQQHYQQKISHVEISSNGITTTLALAMAGESILDAALNQGADLPFACKVGVCASCKAKVSNGKVEMDVNHALTEEEVAQGYILTCQSHPVTDKINIVFD